MRGIIMVCVVIAVLLAACVVSASDWYVGARFGGMSHYWLYPYWYWDDYSEASDFLRHTEYGLFDYRQFDIGLRHDPWAGEVGLGFSSSSYSDGGPNWTQGDSWEEKLTWYTFSLSGLYKFIDPDPVELDLGLRFQLHNATWEVTREYDELISMDEEKASGWSMGPLARARLYFADGAFAIAPEMYLKYSSLTYERSDESDDRDLLEEDDLRSWDIEYSLRLELFF